MWETQVGEQDFGVCNLSLFKYYPHTILLSRPFYI